jgi:hypothetical protein
MSKAMTFGEVLENRRTISREMMAKVEAVVRPIVEEYKQFAPAGVWENLEEGLITSTEAIHHIFDDLNPFPIPTEEPPTMAEVREALLATLRAGNPH